MVFKIEKNLTRTFNQNDLEKAQKELEEAEKALGSFDLKNPNFSVEENRKAVTLKKEKNERVEQIKASLN